MNHAGGQQPEPAAQSTQQHALGDELADDAPTTGAQREAHPHLPASRDRGRQQYVGHVGAGDQQNKTQQRQNDREERAWPRVVEAIVHRVQLGARRLCVTITAAFARHLRNQGRGLGRRLREGSTGLDAPVQLDAQSPAGIPQPGRILPGKRERQPEGRAGRHRPIEAPLDHADHGEGRSHEPHRLADDPLVAAEAPLPEAVIEHRDR
jgi:hypothetical protein